MKHLLTLGLLLSMCTLTEASVPRKPLIEEMTSTVCTYCDLSDSTVHDYEAEFEGELCMLKWHSQFGNYAGENPFYKAYPNGQKRLICYNISGVPQMVGNGLNKINPLQGGQKIKELFDPLFDQTSPFALQVRQVIVGDTVECTVTVTLIDEAFDMNALRLGIVVSEREIHFQEQTTAVNATKVHTNVVRATAPEFLNGVPVITLPSMTQGTEQTFIYRVAINALWNNAMLQTTAFIQDMNTKEVFQSGMSAVPAHVTSATIPLNAVAYPNPSTGKLSITYTLDHASDVSLSIYDATGKSVFQKAEASVSIGQYTPVIDVTHLPNGSYTYRLQIGDIIETRRIVLKK